jgi:predicted ATP-dependent endonuclease of OLD family
LSPHSESFGPERWWKFSRLAGGRVLLRPFLKLASWLGFLKLKSFKMLKSLHITNFRGFRDLKIDSLKRVNLLTGHNNTGKTGVLEALVLLLSDPESGQRQLLPNLFRPVGGDYNENFWKWLIYNKSAAINLQIKASFDDRNDFAVILHPKRHAPIDFDVSIFHASEDVGGFDCFCGSFGEAQRILGQVQRINFKPAVFSTKPSDPVQDAIDFNRVILIRRKKQVEKMLRQIEPRLLTIEALQIRQPGQSSTTTTTTVPPVGSGVPALQTSQPGQQSTPLIYAEISGLSEMIPVTQLGQGFNRLLDIYSEIVATDAKVLLIDEIENGLHYSVLPLVWKGLFLAAQEFDVQIFATTHSWECILKADEAARERENYELELIRLDRVNEDVKATIIDQGALATAKELKWEMR